MNQNPREIVIAGLQRAQKFHQQGNLGAAGEELQTLLDAYPNSAEVHHAMAQLAISAKRNDVALQHLHFATTLAPNHAGMQLSFGCLLAHANQLKAAIAPLSAASKLAPNLPDAWYFLGITYDKLGRDIEALEALAKAYNLGENNPRILAAYADIQFRSGFPDDALPLLERLAKANPDNLDAQLKLAETYSRLGQHAQARNVCETALKGQKDIADIWMALAQIHEDEGNREAAEHAYEQALQQRPNWAFPQAGLLGLLRGRASDELLQSANTALQAEGTTDRDRALIGYELGKALDARGYHEAALSAWDKANEARRRMAGEYDPSALEARIEHMLSLFSADILSKATGSDDERPVFIVGMPRSGTTLTEQIIAAHPQAHGCGELPDIALIAKHLPSKEGGARHWPHIVDEIDPATLEKSVARYLKSATRHAPADAKRLVDKAPLNYYALGLISMMFPKARIIWCRRDPRDIAVSIYGENFALSERFATRMDSIAQCINLQNRLMKHWQKVLPNSILEVRYESLTANPEAEVRRILEFVGLEWDPACLNFHASDRSVQTPSRWQVRQPINTQSIGRWKNYSAALLPLIEALDAESRKALAESALS